MIRNLNRKFLSLVLVFTLILVQLAGVAKFNVKAAGSAFSVQVLVESNSGVILSTTSDKANAFDALKDALAKSGIEASKNSFSYNVNWGSWSLDKIDDIKSNENSYWMYQINRSNSYVDIMTGIDGSTLQNGDRLVVYYAGFNTSYANKITYSTTEVNTPLTISLENYSSWDNTTTPINGIHVKIYNNDQVGNVVYNSAISDNKISIPSGLSAGSYTLVLSDFKLTGTPNVVGDSFVFNIGQTSQPGSTNNQGSNLNNVDNRAIIKDIPTEIKNTSSFVSANSAGDSWSIISLSKLGIKPDLTFIKKSAVDVKKNKGVQDFSNTDLEKLILALTASGSTPYNFMGSNLVSELYNRDINSFLINDAIYGLLAMNYANINGSYGITKDKLVDLILSKKISYSQDGNTFVGWNYSGTRINPDITGLVINALAPYYNSNTNVKTAVNNAIDSLSKLQTEGGYIGDEYGYSSESLSMIILGLTSIGVNPEGTQFTKAKGDLVNALLSYKGTDGAFKHNLDGKNDYMASEQALRALIGLKVFKLQGKYDYYSSNIDSSKLPEFEMTDKELLAAGLLPQTGSVFDFTTLFAAGFSIVLIGVILVEKKRVYTK